MSNASQDVGRRWLPVILVGCVATRLAVLLTDVAGFDGDEAITALMAQRILEGEHFVYFADQRYLGTLEQYVQAAFFAVLPDTAFVSRLPMVGLAAAICWVVHLVSRRVISSPGVALLAPALFAIGPLWTLLLTAKNRGAYSIGLLLGAVGLLLAFDAERTTRPRAVAFCLGLCCGLGFWNNWMAAYLLVPAALWWLASRRGRGLVPLLAIAAAGAVLGAMPALVDAAANGLPTAGGIAQPSTLTQRAQLVAGRAVPVLLGVRARGDAFLVPAVLDLFLTLAAGTALAAGLWTRRRGLLDVLVIRTGQRRPIDAVLLSIVLGLALAIASPTSWFAEEPRYLSPLFVTLPLAVAAGLAAVARGRVLGLAAATLVAMVCASTFAAGIVIERNGGEGNRVAGTPVRHADVVAVADHLTAAGVTTAYADYWLAQPLQFVAGERLIVAPTVSDRFDVAPLVRQASSPAWIVPTGAVAAAHEAAMAAAGSTFTRAQVGPWAIYTAITPAFHP